VATASLFWVNPLDQQAADLTPMPVCQRAALPTGLDGRIGTNFLTTLVKFTGLYVDPWVRALQSSEFRSADRLQLVELFKYLEFCLEQVREGGGALGAVQGLGWSEGHVCKTSWLSLRPMTAQSA
jgi:hypothetical protein